MDISDPKRILLLSRAGTDISPITKFLDPTSNSKTESPEEQASTSLNHRIDTAYYKATIPIWTDSLDDISKWNDEWKTMDGAGEVVAALGAVLFVFKTPSSQAEFDEIRSILSSVSSTFEEFFDFENEDALSGEAPERLAILLPNTTSSSFTASIEELDEMCFEGGNWELINGTEEGKVDEITRERTGLSRLAEALETIDWTQSTDEDVDEADLLAALELDGQGTIEDEDDDAFGTLQDASEAREPILSQDEKVSSRISGIDDPWAKLDAEDAFNNSAPGTEDEVDKITGMMLKLRAVKEQASLLPEAERRKLAAKAVSQVMNKM